MNKISLDALARELRGRAEGNSRGLASRTVIGGHEKALRQTLITLDADNSLGEHDSPGESTVLVLSGRIVLRAGDDSWEGRTGDLLVVPSTRHSLEALEDSAFLLTVVKV